MTQKFMYRNLVRQLIRLACPSRRSPRSALACAVPSFSLAGKIRLTRTLLSVLSF